MPRFQSLVEGTRSRDDGPSLLHSSWIGCLAQRIASHENTHVSTQEVFAISQMTTIKSDLQTSMVPKPNNF